MGLLKFMVHRAARQVTWIVRHRRELLVSDDPRLVIAAIQANAVILGGLLGRALHYPGRPPTLYTALAVFAVLLLLAGFVGSLIDPQADKSRHPAAAGGGCLAYAFGVMLVEPFLFVHGLAAVSLAALVLVPLLLALSYLARCQAWVSVAGVTLFVFASSAMLAGNAGLSHSGSGFFAWWTS